MKRKTILAGAYVRHIRFANVQAYQEFLEGVRGDYEVLYCAGFLDGSVEAVISTQYNNAPLYTNFVVEEDSL